VTPQQLEAIEAMVSEHGMEFLLSGIAQVCFECADYSLRELQDERASQWWHARGKVLAALAEKRFMAADFDARSALPDSLRH